MKDYISPEKIYEWLVNTWKGVQHENENQNQNDTSIEQSKKEIKKTVPFTVASKILKYLGASLIKNVKYLYTENCKTQLKEIKEDLNKWKYNLCLWIRRLDMFKMIMLPKAIWRFIAISIKIPMSLFADMEKFILKFI